MGRRKYYRTSLSSIVFQFICIIALLFCLITSILMLIYLISEYKNINDINGTIFLMIIFLIGALLNIYLESHFLVGNIILEEDRIANYGDNRIGKDKIQFPTFVYYDKITEVDINGLRMKSNGNKNVYFVRPIPFLCIKVNNHTYRFHLSFMSCKTVYNLLEQIKKRCNECGNYLDFNVDELLRKFKNAKYAVKD